MSPCRAMSPKHFITFIIPHHPNHNIHLSNVFALTTDIRFNTPLNLTIHHSCLPLVTTTFNKSLEIFSTTDARSITPWFLHLFPCQLHNLSLHLTPINIAPSFLTTSQPIQLPSSDITVVAWSYMFIVIYLFSVKLILRVEWAVFLPERQISWPY